MPHSNNQVEEVRIKVPWGHIAAKCWNSPDSEPVLVTHGISENAGAFDRLIPLLSKDFYYVCVDLPGHGFSSSFPSGVPLEFMNYVHQLQRLVLHFKWKTYALMGHSFGGHIFGVLAATLTKEVNKLILLDTLAPVPTPKEVYLVRCKNLVYNTIEIEENSQRQRMTWESLDEALTWYIKTRWSQLKPEAAKSVLDRCLAKSGDRYVLTTDVRTRYGVWPSIGEEQHLDNYKRIKCPVLVVLGKQSEVNSIHNSPFCSGVREILGKTHPQSRIAVVTGNHCVHNNDPEAVAPVINRFLSSPRSKY